MSSNPKASRWYSTPAEARKRRGVQVTLSDEARAKLLLLSVATGEPKSAIVERLIVAAYAASESRSASQAHVGSAR